MLPQERKNLEKIYEIEVKNLQNLLNSQSFGFASQNH